MKSQLIILPFVLAYIMSTASTYLTMLIYRGLGLLDKSTKENHPKHIHTTPVPRGGGIGVFIGIFFAMAMFLKLDMHMAVIMLGGLILLIIGIMDDVLDLSPYIRLLIGVAVAWMVVKSGIRINYISNPNGGIIRFNELKWLAEIISILWIVWTMNFVNMGAKGLDGQLPGVMIVASIVMGILSFKFHNDVTSWSSAYLSFALAGSYAGLLMFNAYPQKIMPGWSGGALAGYYLAVLAMLSGAKVATALIVLGIPLMDVVYAIIRRILQGKSPVWGDDSHLHHRLLKAGWSKPKIAKFYWLVTAMLGGIALFLNSRMKVYTIVLIGVVVGGLLIWASYGLPLSRQGRHNG